MTTSTRTIREQNLLQLGAVVGTDAIELQRIARALHKLDEQACNGYQDWRGNWDEAAEKRAEKRQLRLVNEALEIVAAHGNGLYVQSDPRGWPLYVYTPEAFRAYQDRGGKGLIDSCYDSVGIAVCPH